MMCVRVRSSAFDGLGLALVCLAYLGGDFMSGVSGQGEDIVCFKYQPDRIKRGFIFEQFMSRSCVIGSGTPFVPSCL